MTRDGVAVETAEHLSTFAPGPDHLRLAKDAQMPAHAWLAHLAVVRKLGDVHLGRAREALDNEQAGWVGEALEMYGEVTRADGDAAGKSPPRWPRRGVRTHKGIFHKGSLMNVRSMGRDIASGAAQPWLSAASGTGASPGWAPASRE